MLLSFREKCLKKSCLFGQNFLDTVCTFQPVSLKRGRTLSCCWCTAGQWVPCCCCGLQISVYLGHAGAADRSQAKFLHLCASFPSKYLPFKRSLYFAPVRLYICRYNYFAMAFFIRNRMHNSGEREDFNLSFLHRSFLLNKCSSSVKFCFLGRCIRLLKKAGRFSYSFPFYQLEWCFNLNMNCWYASQFPHQNKPGDVPYLFDCKLFPTHFLFLYI